ncbi:hypothetical protein EVAR_59055_1 [Eumeta japonica]|uniref:Uncharacterized protein n=1 Tax=Eumeta variegata TaxID=151549 RepID=A0A4C1YAS3_EUMVA|nr:hypothetical protein EVAR_59055_1 [Eumeta japonica]
MGVTRSNTFPKVAAALCTNKPASCESRGGPGARRRRGQARDRHRRAITAHSATLTPLAPVLRTAGDKGAAPADGQQIIVVRGAGNIARRSGTRLIYTGALDLAKQPARRPNTKRKIGRIKKGLHWKLLSSATLAHIMQIGMQVPCTAGDVTVQLLNKDGDEMRSRTARRAAARRISRELGEGAALAQVGAARGRRSRRRSIC